MRHFYWNDKIIHGFLLNYAKRKNLHPHNRLGLSEHVVSHRMVQCLNKTFVYIYADLMVWHRQMIFPSNGFLIVSVANWILQKQKNGYTMQLIILIENDTMFDTAKFEKFIRYSQYVHSKTHEIVHWRSLGVGQFPLLTFVRILLTWNNSLFESHTLTMFLSFELTSYLCVHNNWTSLDS